MDNLNQHQNSTIRCHLISDFNADNFAGYLNNDLEEPAVRLLTTPFGPVIPKLLELKQQENNSNTGDDFLIVWTRPEVISQSYQKSLSFEAFQEENVLSEVDEFCGFIKQVAGQFKAVFVPSWVTPPNRHYAGLLDFSATQGPEYTLLSMNKRLADNLSDLNNIFLLNTRRWVEHAGNKAFTPKLYYMAKIAFGNGVFAEAVKEVKSAINGIQGQAKKLIVVDLDDTLWDGIVGDLGWENIRLGGHDFIGEAYADFQHVLKQLKNRGILLAIVSKNEEQTALDAIEKHPEMVLKKDDFISWRINWNDKAQNINELAAEVNLGLQSIVFLDDSPYERNRVREALPEVYVPELPKDKTMLASTLLNLRCFDTPRISGEDQERTRMYIQENERKKSQQSFSSLDDWLENMEIVIRVDELNEGNLQRAVQLFNKTNQMNLSTRRMPEHQLTQWLTQEKRKMWTLRVSDRYGDSGLTGILSVEADHDRLIIVDFILSCRVFSRGVEKTMLHLAVEYARTMKCKEITAVYLPTAKNKPCLETLRESGFDENDTADGIEFSTLSDKPFPHPGYVRLLPENLDEIF